VDEGIVMIDYQNALNTAVSASLLLAGQNVEG